MTNAIASPISNTCKVLYLKNARGMPTLCVGGTVKDLVEGLTPRGGRGRGRVGGTARQVAPGTE